MPLLTWYVSLLERLVLVCLSLAVVLDRHRTRVPNAVRRLRGSLRRLQPQGRPGAIVRHRRATRAWNRTLPVIEQRLRELKAAHPHLGNGTLARLLERLTRVRVDRETVRRILERSPLPPRPRTPARRIEVSGPRQLWGIDLTLVWLLGFIPVWILGAVDYHGSRLVCLERLRAPTTAQVQRVLSRVFSELGPPARLISDNGMVFRAFSFELLLSHYGVEHTFTRPRRPQTNGRIERLFRTFKETVFSWIWLFSSVGQVDRFCADFRLLYNRDRPHSRFDGKTPDEVYFDRPKQLISRGPVQYFDGGFLWHKFG